ncbi:uncharacterized protein LOC103094428 isoform X2 [Monodelphis domestica]|uniref:uncharacterized protein LOC103094428 isoform X2 n=1 Tax=Monodelphis domestica TaxID=13616 RepID=UPI0024E25397|nr:uncharacterized protein LOC103094428 isoform X2 [Monodelphis domestica]
MKSIKDADPIPYVWIVDDRQIMLFDMDAKEIAQKISLSSVIDMTYIKQNGTPYFLSHNLLLSISVDFAKEMQLIDRNLPGIPKAIASDWIGQKLYIIINGEDQKRSDVYWLDLEDKRRRLRKMVSVSEDILSIGLDPHKR